MKYLLFLFNYVFISNCVLRSKFKTCEQSGFCKRIYSEKLHTDRFIAKDVVCKSGKISANLYDQYLMAELVFNAFALKNNRLRIHITEKNPKHPRFDIFEHAWRNHQDEPSIDKGTTIIQQNASACEFKLNSNTIQINFEPFLINIINDKKELIISLNTKNGFLIEPNIKKITNQPTKDNNITDEAYIPHETFDGHSDTLPHGYQAVSFDATFHNFEHVFGIPEHADTFSLNSNHARYRLFNLDVFEYELYNQMALYGSVPFMVAKNIEQTIGLLFLNAAEMWVSINKISKSSLLSYLGLNKKRIITEIDTRWVAESGNIDIILMLGKEPKDVLYQYSLTTGFPNLPPLFAIAYHQCRWNYNDAQDVNRVDDTFDKYTIPYDVIWLDIEHTPSRQYFLFDDIKFPNHHQTILNISNKGRKMVTVVDPHVKKSQSYYVYNEVIEHGFDLKTATNNTYVGWCWPGIGDSIYVNYMKQEVRKWYANQFDVNRYKGTTIDVHTWVDMNEPSVFNGPEVTIPKDTHNGEWENRDFHNLYGQMCIDATYQGGLLRDHLYLLVHFFLVHRNMEQFGQEII
ncbi:hypothetical protein HZS_5560 [Henneguya salminicola]|nr:hypothetical protein HZS_5560 [Henneguya salminicola]